MYVDEFRVVARRDKGLYNLWDEPFHCKSNELRIYFVWLTTLEMFKLKGTVEEEISVMMNNEPSILS